MPLHVVKQNPPQPTTEIGYIATIGCCANTHFSGLSVIEILPYTYNIVLWRSTIMPHRYASDVEILTYKRPPRIFELKDQGTAAIHSQNKQQRKTT
jgi:hypothetical protein